MPASLAPTTVDIVATLERIGPLLHELVTGLYLPEASEEDGALRTFLAQVRERSGIDFAPYKMPPSGGGCNAAWRPSARSTSRTTSDTSNAIPTSTNAWSTAS